MTRHFVLGTAGHVDHGKTTLVRALTGVDTDRLPEEKRRGITIELGFAPWAVDDETRVSVVDVPGHRKLVHTMIAGAAGMELVMLVVAADEGVMPQTREHVAACELLGVERAVVAISKIDRVDAELAALAGEEVSALLAGRLAHDVVLCSAKTGAGLAELRAAVRKALHALPTPPTDRPAYLSVDRAFSVKGAGTVVTGTLVRGKVRVGDSLQLVGRTATRVTAARGLHVHDQALQAVDAPTRLAINLAGVSVDEVRRGDVITPDSGVRATMRFDGALQTLVPIKPSSSIELYVGTARSPARLQFLSHPADVDGPTFVRLRLDKPIPMLGGDRFVLRAGGSRSKHGAVIGGGVVLDARAPASRDRSKRLAVLRAAHARDASSLARAVVLERAPKPVEARHLQARFTIEAPAIERAAEKAADRGEVVRLKDAGYADRDAIRELAIAARTITAGHHLAHPLDRGMKLETLRQQLSQRAGLAVAQEAVRVAGRKGLPGELLVVEGDVARMEGFVDGLVAGKASGPLEQARIALGEAALKGLGDHALHELLRLPTKEVKAVLAKLVRDGLAINTKEQWFDAVAVAALRARVIDYFQASPLLTIADFKELSGLGRKQAIALLEVFDRDGTCARKGDDRVPGPKSQRAAPA